ncbi:hypothetical protein HZS_4072 [Henneguya salminicola]|nr:hypothetical protein HZS_4072 [Henneguya salminicola]
MVYICNLFYLKLRKQNSTWIGENIAWGVGNCSTNKNFIDCGDIFEGISRWYSEAENYDILRNRCSGQCSLYTQLVWASTTLVGCGAKRCEDNKTILVCNYFPGGNHVNKLPYTIGTKCSSCPTKYSKCQNSLCVVSEIEQHQYIAEVKDIMSIETYPNSLPLISHKSLYTVEVNLTQETIKIPIGWKSLNLSSYNFDVDQNNNVWMVLENQSVAVLNVEDGFITAYPRFMSDNKMKFERVSSNGETVWALLEDMNTVMYLPSINDMPFWYKVDTGDMQIAKIETKRKDVVWVLTKDTKLFYRSEISVENKAGLSWSSIDFEDQKLIKDLICGALACWVITIDDEVYVRYGINSATPKGLTWVNLNTIMSEIFSGYNGFTIGKLNNAIHASSVTKSLYFWRTGITVEDPGGTGWLLIKLPQSQQICIGSSIIVAIQHNHNIILKNSYPREVNTESLNMKKLNDSIHVSKEPIGASIQKNLSRIFLNYMKTTRLLSLPNSSPF